MPWSRLRVPSWKKARRPLATDSAHELDDLTLPSRRQTQSDAASETAPRSRFYTSSVELPYQTQQPPDRRSSAEPAFWSLSDQRIDLHGPAPVGRSRTAPSFPCTTAQPLQGHPRYRFLEEINRGTSGFVQKALDMRTGQPVAVKLVPRGPGAQSFDAQHITRELLNHRMVGRHPNIVQLLEVFPTEHHLAIVMEFAAGGDLSELIDARGSQDLDGIPEADAAWFIQQLVCAVEFCHRLGVANRDIKLDNMLLHSGGRRPMLRICDFGYSKDELGQSVSKSTCGTPEYMAPEVLFESRYDGKAADVWSCGVSLFVLLTGDFPFTRASDAELSNTTRMQRMFTRIVKGDVAPVPHLSASCQDLLRRMLTPQPDDRITLQQVAEHPWLATAQPLLSPLVVNDRVAEAMRRFADMDGPGCRQSAAEIVQLVAACAEARQQPPGWRSRLLRLPRRELRSASHGSVQGLGPLNGRSLSGGPSLPPLSAADSAYQYSGPAPRKVTEYEAGWLEGAKQSAELRTTPPQSPGASAFHVPTYVRQQPLAPVPQAAAPPQQQPRLSLQQESAWQAARSAARAAQPAVEQQPIVWPPPGLPGYEHPAWALQPMDCSQPEPVPPGRGFFHSSTA